MSVYLTLTDEFNRGKLRAVISSGQAVVLHQLAIMSKDGDWILREEEEDMHHVLTVLEKHEAHYRFGAPLDTRWLSHGWSSHLEFRMAKTRVRTDFVTRPPRISMANLEKLWKDQEGNAFPFVDARNLLELKKTNREKDYAVIGELARVLEDPRDQLLCSRSARDLMALAQKHDALIPSLAAQRPILFEVGKGVQALETALDAERRELMHVNEARLAKYIQAAGKWAEIWPEVQSEIRKLPLDQAHRIMVSKAEGILPFDVGEN